MRNPLHAGSSLEKTRRTRALVDSCFEYDAIELESSRSNHNSKGSNSIIDFTDNEEEFNSTENSLCSDTAISRNSSISCYSPSGSNDSSSRIHGSASSQLQDEGASTSCETRNGGQQQSQVQGGRSSVYGASFNFVNSIVGAGIIGIPYALRECGFYLGIAMLVLVALIVDQSVILLIDCGLRAQKLDYEELSHHLLGNTGYYLATCFMFLFAFGAQIAYMVIVGDTIPTVVQNFTTEESLFQHRPFVVVAFATIIVLPLCLLKELSSLSCTSMISILSDVVLVSIVAFCSPSEARRQGLDPSISHLSMYSPNVFAGIGTIAFAFVCQHNSFMIFRSLKEPTIENWRFVAHFSVGFSLFLSLIIGVVGYYSFEEVTHGDILTNFPHHSFPVSIARLLLALCMVFTFPMECYVSRHCLLSVIDKVVGMNENSNAGFASLSQEDLLKSVVSVLPSSSTHGDVAASPVDFDSFQIPRTCIIRDSDRVNPVFTSSSRTTPSSVSVIQHHSSVEEGSYTRLLLSVSSLWYACCSFVCSSCSSISPSFCSASCSSSASSRAKSQRRIIVTLLLWGIPVVIAVLCEKLGIVLALTGAIAASSLGFVLPAVIYFKTNQHELSQILETFHSDRPDIFEPSLYQRLLSLRSFFFPAFMIVFGIAVLILGVSTVLLGGASS